MKRPPIEGLPAMKDRPRCGMCNKPLRPVVDVERAYPKNAPSYDARRWWTGRFSSYRGVFCTLRCALDFAAAAYVAGYRRVT